MTNFHMINIKMEKVKFKPTKNKINSNKLIERNFFSIQWIIVVQRLL